MSFGVAAIFTAATAVETVAAIAYTVGTVGLALTGVGIVTGNKNLTKIGGEMGLVGGIGSLGAAAAGGLSSAATDAAASSAATSGVADTSTQAGSSLINGGTSTLGQNAAIDAGNSTAGIANSGNMIDLANSGSSIAPSTSLANQITGNPALLSGGTDYLGNPIGTTTGSAAASDAALIGSNTTVPQATDISSNANNAASNATSASGVNMGSSVNGNSPILNHNLQNSLNNASNTGGPGMVSWFKSLDPGSQELVARGVLGAAGQLAQGYTQQQQLALQTLMNDQSMQRYNTAMSNANAVPIISFTPQRGLLNSTVTP